MEWSTEKPKECGYYWIYTIPIWEDKPVVMCVGVLAFNDNKFETRFDIPMDGYECEDKISVERTTHWMGPIEEPEPPKV